MDEARTKYFALEPNKTYLVTLSIPKVVSSKEAPEVTCNKMELKLKTLGIKNVTVVPYGIGIHEISG